MNHQSYARRLLVALLTIALAGFMAEAAWSFLYAVNPVNGQPLRLADLQVTPEMMRSAASSFSRAYNNLLALLLTFISLAIPLTANLYTPKLIEVFIRDRTNMIVLCGYALLAAHSLLAVTVSFDQWTLEFAFWVNGIGAIVGWLVLMPYYFYVLSFIDPLTIIKRVHLSLMHELADAARSKYAIDESQARVNLRLINLGSMLQRSVDRADRDVTFDAIRAHTLDLARVRDFKDRLPHAFFNVTSQLMIGMSRPATEMLSRERTWMEQRIAGQLVLAFKTALHKMPEAISPLVHAVKNAAHEEALRGNQAVFRLLVRTLNSFLREAIKKKENAQVYAVVYNYKSLIRRLMDGPAEPIVELARYQRYYAELARTVGLTFSVELISYELAELTELACARKSAAAPRLLDAVLEFEGVEQSVGLVKSRLILAAYFHEQGMIGERDRVMETLTRVPEPVWKKAGESLLGTTEAVFWEVTDRGMNIDYVPPARRMQIAQVMEEYRRASAPG